MKPSNENDSRTHVLFLVDGLMAWGGGEGALLKIARHLPHDRFRCSLAVLKSGGKLYELFREASCPVYEFPVSKILRPKAFKTGWQLRKFMRREKVDIVHTFFETANLWGALVAKLGGGGPLVVSSRRDMGILRSARHHIAYRILHPLFDSVVAVSRPVRESCIREEKIEPDRVITLYNGVELDRIDLNRGTANVREKLGLSHASHVITSVGHIRRYKGFDVFIRAAAQVCREFPKAVFVIIGGFHDKAYVRELTQLAQELGVLDNIRLAGAFDDVVSALKSSDLFCLLSRTEGFSNALVEAMACGLPVVATRVGGAEEVIRDGHNGFLVNSEDADTAAQRILDFLRNRDLARKAGAEARETVRSKFTAEIMGKTLAQHYDGLLRTKRFKSKQNKNSNEAPTTGDNATPERLNKMDILRHQKKLLRPIAKRVYVRFLWSSGLLALAKWWVRRKGAVVLTFHRVIPRLAFSETTVQKGMLVSDESFAKLLAYLQKRYAIVDLGRERPKKHHKQVQLALTFDDGWEDNASVAFPIVKKFNTPVTIFICPELMGRSLPFWPDHVVALIRSAEAMSSGIAKVASALAAAGHPDWATELQKEDADQADRLIEHLKQVPAQERKKVMESLLGCQIPTEQFVNLKLDRTMSWSQVRRLNEAGVTFGSHTQHHELLPQIPRAQVEEEVKASKTTIRENLSKECSLFSYPNGAAAREVRDMVSSFDFSLAFINSPGIWLHDGDDYLIPRINIWENDLTDSRGRFSALAFEYSAIWRAFTYALRSRG
ncbi:MAG: glycosyltransferase [Candidatus Acidiferrum sp.]|jgi:glycosyltransferase involved in cell wall biosynthesis/peptidoglycan/xylan/chitin deacetylase (PgdA/CDA1 family)